VPGGPAATADDLLAGVEMVAAAGAREVVLLPNDPDLWDAAEWAADAARACRGVDVRIVPTRTAAEGLAALAVADGGRPFGDDVAAMAASAGGMRCGEVAVAAYAADTAAGPVRRGDAVGLVDGDVEIVGRDPLAVAVEGRGPAARGSRRRTADGARGACVPAVAGRPLRRRGRAGASRRRGHDLRRRAAGRPAPRCRVGRQSRSREPGRAQEPGRVGGRRFAARGTVSRGREPGVRAAAGRTPAAPRRAGTRPVGKAGG